MAPCTDFDPLLAARASGADALDPPDAARLDAHLAGCDRCRAELAAWEKTLGFARLPAPTDAERQPLSHLATRARAELDRSPIMKAFWRLLALTAVSAAVVVVVANQVILPSARRQGAAAQVSTASWVEPDVEALLAKVEQAHPELAIASESGLARAEQLADAAYLRALGEAE